MNTTDTINITDTINTTVTRSTVARSTTNRHRRSIRGLAALLVVMTGAIGAVAMTDGAQPVAAATQVRRGGSPGSYTVGKVRSSVVYNAERGAYYGALTVDGPTVWRSPATAGYQNVTLYTELWMYTTSGWKVAGNRYSELRLATASGTFWPATFNSLSPAYYFVRQYILWGTSYVQVDYNYRSDYVCSGGTPVRTICTPYSAGYVYVLPAYR